MNELPSHRDAVNRERQTPHSHFVNVRFATLCPGGLRMAVSGRMRTSGLDSTSASVSLAWIGRSVQSESASVLIVLLIGVLSPEAAVALRAQAGWHDRFALWCLASVPEPISTDGSRAVSAIRRTMFGRCVLACAVGC